MTPPHDDRAGTHTPPISDYVRDGDISDLRAVIERLRMGENGSPPKSDGWKWIGAAVAVITLVLSVAGSAQSVVASNQRLIDKIDNIDIRVGIIEKARAENLPRIDGEISKAASENKMQSDRIQSAAEALADERRARNDDNAATRKAQADILAMISKLADKVADVDKGLAVMQAPGRRSEGPRQQPQRDAFNPGLMQ